MYSCIVLYPKLWNTILLSNQPMKQSPKCCVLEYLLSINKYKRNFPVSYQIIHSLLVEENWKSTVTETTQIKRQNWESLWNIIENTG